MLKTKAANSFESVALEWLENIRPKWTEDHYAYTLRRFKAYPFTPARAAATYKHSLPCNCWL